ncbi:MAG: gamma-glutamyltransferase [Woeseiaceae bacterium]|nr:gamma-glutamyltransferase [Woeseiaceae bacterium]
MKRHSLPVLLLMCSAATHGYDRTSGAPFASRSEVIAPHAMAATSQPLATQVALDVLKAGGSAVDAAIAANAMLGLVEPTGCGIGGDLFAIVWDAEAKELTGLNASGRSPQSLTLDYFQERGLDEVPYLGPLTVSVPGAVDGWYELHGRYGRLPMAELLQPAIDYAEAGFPVTEMIADLWQENVESRKQYAGVRDTFMPGGKSPRKGEMFRNPRLAATYRTIAGGGRDAFYKGDIARRIGAYMAEQGGFLSYEDMAAHESEWVTPVSTNYRGYDLYELPPNTQGIAALQLLNVLEGYDLAAMGFGSAEYVHTFVEAKKVVYEDRAKFYADPAFYDAPVEALISRDYAAQRRELISMQEAARSYPAGHPRLEDGDTIYLAVADSDGNMISLIQSNYGDLGSGMTPADLGFMLQNRGALFSLKEGHANVYAPGKRPFHTIIPAFVMKDGEPYMAFGVMGGAMQPQGHAQILVNIIDFGMNLQAAGDAARIRHTGSSQPTDQVMSEGGTVCTSRAVSARTCAGGSGRWGTISRRVPAATAATRPFCAMQRRACITAHPNPARTGTPPVIDAMPQDIYLTGITTTGTPHIGNYVGAIRPCIAASRDKANLNYFFLADLHALAKAEDPDRIARSTLEIAASWLALGLDTTNAVFYRQSDIPEIPQLTWILTSMTAKGLMNRAHSYKAAVQANEESGARDPDKGITMALYSYPILMAADILMFRSTRVPVGRDQKQHVEMARDIAQRFNHHYGDILVLPEPVIDDNTAVLAGLDGRKMSKSYNNTIPLFVEEKKLKKLIMKIKTNSLEPGEPKDPDDSALFDIYKAFATRADVDDMKKRYAEGIAWGEMKQVLFEYINEQIKPARDEYRRLIDDPAIVEAELQKGADKAREVAVPFMNDIRHAVGIRSLG